MSLAQAVLDQVAVVNIFGVDLADATEDRQGQRPIEHHGAGTPHP